MSKQKLENTKQNEDEEQNLLYKLPIQKNHISVGGAIGLSFSIILLIIAFLILYSLFLKEEAGFDSWRGIKIGVKGLFERNLLDQLTNAWKQLVEDITRGLKKIPKLK